MMKKLLMIVFLFILISCEGKVNGAQNSSGEKSNNKYAVTLVELGSVRCVPCKMMTPVLEKIRKKYADKVKVVFYDVWKAENKFYAKKYKIRVIPTQVFLDKNGIEYFRHEGFFPFKKVEEIIKKKL